MTGKNITTKILESHLLSGSLQDGEEIAISSDQCILQDATGTQACQQAEEILQKTGGGQQGNPGFQPLNLNVIPEPLVIDESLQNGMRPLLQFEQFGTEKSPGLIAVQYVDHNIKQIDERNADDHAFLLSFAQRHGIWYSPLGNGICHQVHVERFAIPGAVIIGADSHTTTSGAMGALALGVGGLDVAAVLAGYPFRLKTPKVVKVELRGELKPWVSATDIILELLRRYRVSWGISVAGIGGTMVLEFGGPGVATLRLSQRATIANMAAELNATAIFPSDEQTLKFLRIQRRAASFRPLEADTDAAYDLEVIIDLEELEPLIAKPSNPDNVVPVREVEGTPVVQVAVGSSVNSWYECLAVVAMVLNGQRLPMVETPEGHRLLQLLVSPGSHQILNILERKGFIKDLRQAGAVILESACGPCVGMGGAPPSNTNSLRTMNRNFPGRSGTKNDRVWLASPETAAATARYGLITDPRRLGAYPDVGSYTALYSDFTDHLFVRPIASSKERKKISIIRGPHIQPPPRKETLPGHLTGEVIAKFGDNISTGSISPDGVIVMGKRSNIADIARHTFEKEMPSLYGGVSQFYLAALETKKRNGSFVLAGNNYGQGSSREAAAMVMVELNVHAVCAKSFARIHRANLIAQGVLPLVVNDDLYAAVVVNCTFTLPYIREELEEGNEAITVHVDKHVFLQATHHFSLRERNILLAGGLINYLASEKKS